MKPRLLFIIDSDPVASGRAAEAVRIAAGIAVWNQVAVSLYFRGAAAQALGEDAEELAEGDQIVRSLSALREAGARILSDADTSDDALAALAAEQTTVVRF